MEQLIASVRDEVHYLRFSYTSANSKTAPKWKAEPLPRPGVGVKKKKKLSTPQADTLWTHLQNMSDT